MHDQVGPQSWFPQNIERFQRLGSLTAGITIMAYGKITKVKNGKEKSNFQKKYFSLLLWGTQQLICKRKNEIHR